MFYQLVKRLFRLPQKIKNKFFVFEAFKTTMYITKVLEFLFKAILVYFFLLISIIYIIVDKSLLVLYIF